MKYESTILKRLIDTYGVVGNPRYISEIIKEFIVRGKECFPELFTYQADWLAHIDEFGLNTSYTVSYTGHSFYAPNTLERPVKIAILKGCTLVNLLTRFMPNVDYIDRQFRIILKNVGNFDKITVVNKNSKPIRFSYYYANVWNNHEVPASGNILVEIPEEITTYNIFPLDTLGWESANYKSATDNVVLLHGDYANQDIPYFEGMQSVKMPVLTASNEDGTKTNILTVNEDVELGSVGEVKDELNLLTQQLTQRTETRPYQEGDELNSEFVTDMTNTRYKLAQEVVKTVDLTILDQNGQNVKQLMSFNGGTHFTTGSLEGSLLPSVSVSVETNLEETLKVCSLEGNTM